MKTILVGADGSPAGDAAVARALALAEQHAAAVHVVQVLPIDAAHFDRWLALFEETAQQVCPPVAAEHFIVRARRIAQSLELGVALQAGARLRVGERFRRESC